MTTRTMNTRDLNIEIELTEELLAGIIVTAVEGGINYWATVEDYSTGGFPDDPATVWAELTDDQNEDESEVLRLTLDAVALGLERILNGSVELNTTIRGWIWQGVTSDPGMIDATAADCIAQAGLLGDVLYG